MVAEVNGLANAPGAEQLIPETAPPPTPFGDVARMASQLRRDHAIALAAVDLSKPVSSPIAATRVYGADLVQAASHKLEYRPAARDGERVLTRPEPGYRLTFPPAAQGRPDAEAFRQLLRLEPSRLEYGLRRVDVPGGVALLPLPDVLDSIDVRTRT